MAQRLGKGQSTVANKLRLLKLPQQVQDALLNKLITERHARSLIPLKRSRKASEIVRGNNLKRFQCETNGRSGCKNARAIQGKPKPKRKAFSKDMRIAVNTIRQSLSMVSDNGINLDSEEEEFEEYYQFTIKIPKRNNNKSSIIYQS